MRLEEERSYAKLSWNVCNKDKRSAALIPDEEICQDEEGEQEDR